MFQNQSYKQKLSFYHNEDVDNIANINIVLSTNHEINKDMLTNISDTISKLFINNYTNMDEIIQRANDEKQKLKDDKKEEAEKKRDDIQRKKDDRERNKRMWDDKQEHDRMIKLENLKVKNDTKQVILKQSAIKPHWKRKT